MFVTLYFFILILGCLVGPAIYFQNGAPMYLKWIPSFLLITLCVSWLGVLMSNRNINNVELYNFFTVLEICFYLFSIRETLKNRHIRKAILLSIGIYPILSLSNILFISGIHVFHSVTYGLGAALIIISTLFYFNEHFRSPRDGSIFRKPHFWICSGLLFFYGCSLPYFLAINLLAPLTDPKYDSVVTMLERLNLSANIVYYSFFVISFLCVLKNL